MHRNKKITLTILLSFISALPITGASTAMLVKQKLPFATIAASIAVVKLIEYLQPPGLVALVIDYCKPNIVNFEITLDNAIRQTNDGITHTQKGPWLPDPHCPNPFVGIYKPYALCPAPGMQYANGMQFVISYYDALNHKYKNWGPIFINDILISLTKGYDYCGSSSPYALQWNNGPLEHVAGCTIKVHQSCDVAIVDHDPVLGRGSKIVGRIYDTEDMVTWKALTQALATPTELLLPSEPLSVSDNSSFSSSTSDSSASQPVFAYVG